MTTTLLANVPPRVFDRPQDLSLGRHVGNGPGAGHERFLDDRAVAQVPEHDSDVVVPVGVAPEHLGRAAVHRQHIGTDLHRAATTWPR